MFFLTSLIFHLSTLYYISDNTLLFYGFRDHDNLAAYGVNMNICNSHNLSMVEVNSPEEIKFAMQTITPDDVGTDRGFSKPEERNGFLNTKPKVNNWHWNGGEKMCFTDYDLHWARDGCNRGRCVSFDCMTIKSENTMGNVGCDRPDWRLDVPYLVSCEYRCRYQ